jgi:hypothetical protein
MDMNEADGARFDAEFNALSVAQLQLADLKRQIIDLQTQVNTLRLAQIGIATNGAGIQHADIPGGDDTDSDEHEQQLSRIFCNCIFWQPH